MRDIQTIGGGWGVGAPPSRRRRKLLTDLGFPPLSYSPVTDSVDITLYGNCIYPLSALAVFSSCSMSARSSPCPSLVFPWLLGGLVDPHSVKPGCSLVILSARETKKPRNRIDSSHGALIVSGCFRQAWLLPGHFFFARETGETGGSRPPALAQSVFTTDSR